MDVILKENVTDVCVVATRYFGGTLLGAGGLVRAYSHTSKIALDAAHIITMANCQIYSVIVDYSFYDRLNVLLSDFGANVIKSDFSASVSVEFSIKEDASELLKDKLTDISNGKYSLNYLRSEFAKI